MTDLAAAIATERQREAEANARADALERRLAQTRHDLRDLDSGRYRPRNSAEVHAQAVRDAIAGRKDRKAPLIAALTGVRHDPLHGFTPVTEQHVRPLPPRFTFDRLDG